MTYVWDLKKKHTNFIINRFGHVCGQTYNPNRGCSWLINQLINHKKHVIDSVISRKTMLIFENTKESRDVFYFYTI